MAAQLKGDLSSAEEEEDYAAKSNCCASINNVFAVLLCKSAVARVLTSE